ncbi:hypothetical protein D3C76_895980 [compost metagenome]
MAEITTDRHNPELKTLCAKKMSEEGLATIFPVAERHMDESAEIMVKIASAYENTASPLFDLCAINENKTVIPATGIARLSSIGINIDFKCERYLIQGGSKSKSCGCQTPVHRAFGFPRRQYSDVVSPRLLGLQNRGNGEDNSQKSPCYRCNTVVYPECGDAKFHQLQVKVEL